MLVLPTIKHFQMWPICFATHTLAPLPAPAMHNRHICQNQSACVNIFRWRRGVRATGNNGTILAENGTFPNLLQYCRFPGLKAHLHNGLMQKNRLWGRGLGMCIPWVTMLRLDLGANTGNAISPQPVHAFKPDKAWELRGITVLT